MNRKEIQRRILLLPIGSIFTLNGISYKKMEGYYATKGYIEGQPGFVKKVQFNELNITIRANVLTSSYKDVIL